MRDPHLPESLAANVVQQVAAASRGAECRASKAVFPAQSLQLNSRYLGHGPIKTAYLVPSCAVLASKDSQQTIFRLPLNFAIRGAKFGVTMLHMLKHFRADTQLRSRGYALVVVSLASFLAVLILWPSPFHGHLATIVVVARTASGAPMPTSDASGSLLAVTERELTRQLGEREFLAAAFGATGDEAGLTLRAPVVQSVRRGLGVKHLTHDTDEARIAITVLRDSESQALLTAELLAAELIRRRSYSDRQTVVLADHRRRQWALVEARHYEKRARQTLDNFVQEHLQRAQQHTQKLFNSEPSFDTATADVSAATTVDGGEVNPRWVTLSEELETLYEQRDELLRRLTVNHPRVQDISVEVARKEQDLADMPKYLGDTQQTAAFTDEGNVYRVEQVQQVLDQFGSAMVEDYRELHDQFDQAVQKRETREVALMESTGQLSALRATAFCWQIESDRSVKPLGSRPSFGLVAILMLVSMGSGWAFVSWRERVTTSVFRSAQEVQTVLRLPTVVEVSGAQATASPKLGGWQERGPRVLLTMCELLLAVLTVILVLAALLGNSLWWELMSDPLGTLTHLFRHLV